MSALKSLLLVLGFFLFLPSPVLAVEAQPSSVSSASPFTSPQGVLASGLIRTLMNVGGEFKTAGFGPVVTGSLYVFFGAMLGDSGLPVFFQNGQGVMVFAEELKNKTPGQIIQLFNHDIVRRAAD